VSESTRLTVLGMVRRRPRSYGYSLVDEVQRWSGPEGVVPAPRAVYKALEVLRDGRLIEPLQVVSDRDVGGPSRRRYIATPAGERRYEAWLSSPPESFADLFRRLATAREDDLPELVELVVTAEHQLIAHHRDLRAPEVGSLVKEQAPWEAVCAAALAAAERNEVASRATFLRDLRRTLEDLRERPNAGTVAP